MVSIVLVTYNRADRLRLSIQDILNQSFKEFELIICDDCSTDSTETVCREFLAQDKRVKYVRHSKNLRMPGNCNFGIKEAIYPYVAILHDGDRFKFDLIEQWYKAISANDSVGFVFNAVGVTDANENVLSHIFEYDKFKEGIIKKEHLLKDVFFRSWRFYSPVFGEAMVKKKIVEGLGLLKEKYGFYADVDLWMQLLHSHDAYFCSDTLITGPARNIQPHLFDDSLIKTFIYMFTMQLAHRRKAFKKQPFKLIAELFICWTQAFFNLNYNLLLVVKNFSFKSFMGTYELLKGRFVFLIPWITVLFFYPLLYPFLKLFDFVKIVRRRPMVAAIR